MPESKGRPAATSKKAAKRQHTSAPKSKQSRFSATGEWAPYVFVPMFVIGVLWLVVYYVAGNIVPGMNALGNWNFLVGITLIAGGFIVAMFWK